MSFTPNRRCSQGSQPQFETEPRKAASLHLERGEVIESEKGPCGIARARGKVILSLLLNTEDIFWC
jgi:hypothetical protein